MILLITILIFFALLIVYLSVIRRWQLRWGATENEVKLKLPGDEFVVKPNFNATRAITIKSTPDSIWPWIIQIGSGRAGWYSIDWIDNGGHKSATTILSKFQNIEVGQFIPFTPNQKNGMWVKTYHEFDHILWVDKAGNATWLWYLIPISPSQTRLLTRLRSKYIWKGFWIIYYLVADVGDIVMMTKCMKGIKKRAEADFQPGLRNQA